MLDKPAHERRAARAAELRAKHAKLIAEAGIPAEQHSAVLDSLDSIFQDFAAMPAPKRTSDAKALQDVITAAEKAGTSKLWREKLEKYAAALPPGLRFNHIFEYQGYRDGKQLADELPAKTILSRAKALQARIKRGRGRPRAELATLLFRLLEVWEREMPGCVGIDSTNRWPNLTRKPRWRTKVRSTEYFDGPLLNLVEQLLDVEGVEFGSRDSIGRELWNFVQIDAAQAQRHAAGKCATANCGGSLTTPENWLCDECRADQHVGLEGKS